MYKNVARFDYIVEEKSYHIMCDNDAPIDHLDAVLIQCQKDIKEIKERLIKEQEEKQSSKITEVETNLPEVENVG